ncbi:energy-coupling factor transporter transmembrane component T [Paenibacillus thalictri]|uniref:Energy-coupling factor transporter transmembrane protein EcfT n=1 Tax=Paenibacillus thalictri TaxID=2527873 RepID=A0A4Q9DQI3_9BACL|nr:energy-coupling factor transporter transmembrane component T [Paenibacillus thalictri]TBL77642.1 energy-coupling factor transporter transmembrane protein EcfT [Paenibacillus thalictri]
MKDSFSTYHPIVNFVYFVVVLVFGMVFMHPVFQTIALVSAVTYSIRLKGKRALTFSLLYMLPLLLLMAALNPLFNHAGATILYYPENGNPITLESVLYGVASALMFVTIIVWFSCYNAVMTSDKFIYLFGKMMPALSLIFSMVLRFVPRYAAQIKTISNAQKCVGMDVSQGSLAGRARNGIKILSVMTTWALENAIETADSMKSRGYGLPHRTSFSIFRFDRRDRLAVIAMAVLITVVLTGAALGENTIRFFPSIKLKGISLFGIVVDAAYFVLCMIPVICSIVEDVKWKYIASKM